MVVDGDGDGDGYGGRGGKDPEQARNYYYTEYDEKA